VPLSTASIFGRSEHPDASRAYCSFRPTIGASGNVTGAPTGVIPPRGSCDSPLRSRAPRCRPDRRPRTSFAVLSEIVCEVRRRDDSHAGQCGYGFGLPPGVPSGAATRMQPNFTCVSYAEGQEGIM
jgi:hypothetical protein